MQVWTVANQKGGVGKTTTSVSLAGIAAEQGSRVLLIDMDPHGSLTSWFKLNPDQLTHSVFDLFEQRTVLSHALISSVIQPSHYHNLSLIPAAVVLATLERRAVGEGMGLVLKNSLSIIADDFDLVILDCPPQLGVLLVNALAASSDIIIPVQTEFLAIQGLERMLNTLAMMQRSRGEQLNHCIVPVMYDRRTQASVQSLRQIRMDYGSTVWPGKIPVDTRLRDASKAGVPVNIYASKSRSTLAYQSLYSYLLEHVQSRVV